MRKKWKIQKRWENKEGVLIQVGLEKDSSLPFGRPKEGFFGAPRLPKAASPLLLYILEV